MKKLTACVMLTICCYGFTYTSKPFKKAAACSCFSNGKDEVVSRLAEPVFHPLSFVIPFY